MDPLVFKGMTSLTSCLWRFSTFCIRKNPWKAFCQNGTDDGCMTNAGHIDMTTTERLVDLGHANLGEG